MNENVIKKILRGKLSLLKTDNDTINAINLILSKNNEELEQALIRARKSIDKYSNDDKLKFFTHILTPELLKKELVQYLLYLKLKEIK